MHKAAERLQRQVVQMVSHDLRSPLSAIQGFYEMLGNGMLGALDDQGQRLLEMAARNSARMSELTEDLLDIEKIDAGKIELHITETSVEAIFRDAAQTVAMQAARKNITLDVSADNVTLIADQRRLTQVVVNLLNNAVKFTANNGKIHMSCRRRPSLIEIEVSDTGRGIAAEDLPFIFDRFRQTQVDDSRVLAGKGLGLSICKALVELHQGTIAVRSTVGSGTSFTVTIPSGGGGTIPVGTTSNTTRI
jgi:signal transduction histidine kinase